MPGMPDRPDRPQHALEKFKEILAAEEQPLVVGGQAVNLWAELYVAALPELETYAPFTSKDADIYGNRALAETLAKRMGWQFKPVSERDSMVVGFLTKHGLGSTPTLTIDVLAEVNGLNEADLSHNTVIEFQAGQRYRVPTPLVLLKAKLYNLISLTFQDRPQDLKQAKMLMHIVPQYLNELAVEQRRGNLPIADLLGAIDYARQIVHSGASYNAAQLFGFDYRQLIPASLDFGPPEVKAGVRALLEGLPQREER